MTPSRRRSASASGCSAARPCTSRWRPRSSTTCASSGPVGEDFGEPQLAVMRARGVDVSDIERVAGGKTFFWHGEYGWDLNSRETLDTQLGVFEGFAAEALRALALERRAVPRQHPARPAARGARPAAGCALRRARLDEPVDRHRARLARGGDRERRLRDPQRRRAAPADRQAEPRLRRARDPHLVARRRGGRRHARPQRDRRQAGRVRRGADHARGLLRAARLSAGDA